MTRSVLTSVSWNSLVCSVAAAVLLSGSAVSPQGRQPPNQPPAFRSTIDVVRVEASVLDKDRRPVRGLTAQDFTVLEDGRERPVVVFAPVDVPPASTETATGWVSEAPRDVVSNEGTNAGRLVVIAFDWSIRFYDQALARRIALAAVDGLAPADQAAVLFTMPGGGARPQGFTADHALLRAAINQPFAVALTDPHPDRSRRIIDPEGHERGDCLCGVCTLDSLTQLGRTLRTVSQRPKVVLFIGTYVRTFEAMEPTAAPTPVPGRITPSFSTMRGTTDCPGRLRDAREAFERSMGEANVTVHVIDPVGMDSEDSTPLGAGRMRERLDSLPALAELTGGRTVTNTSAPQARVASILGESGSYYILGFTPAATGKADGIRRVEVRVRPGGLTVKARNQYSLAQQTSTGRPQDLLTQAVNDVLPARDVPMEVAAVPFIAGQRTTAVVVGRVGAAARPTAMLTAVLTARAVPVTSRRIAIPPARGEAARPAWLGLVSVLALDPGTYELRTAVESPGGAAGSAHTFVEIPDFRRARLSMSGLLLHVAPDEPVALNELGDALPFAPTARRRFASTDLVSALVQVSQGTARKEALQPATLRLRIHDPGGAEVRNQDGALDPAGFARNRTASARLAVPIRGLSPGEYLLSLEATLGPDRVERWVRFEVR